MKWRLLLTVALGLASIYFVFTGVFVLVNANKLSVSNGLGAWAMEIGGAIRIAFGLLSALIAWILYRKQSR